MKKKTTRPRIALSPSDEQFAAFERATRAAGEKRISTWALAALTRLVRGEPNHKNHKAEK